MEKLEKTSKEKKLSEGKKHPEINRRPLTSI